MCGRFTLRTPTPVLIEHFGMGKIPELPPRFNIAPTQDVAVVRNSSDDDRQWAMLRWGLIPFWAKDASIGNRMINARGETVSEKPSFRHAFRHRRCLVAADGFYEWQKKGRQKQPYYVHLKEHQPLAFAGLWERWQPKDSPQQPVETCTIITTVANELMRDIHERMPVILSPDDYHVWLDPDIQVADELESLLVPYPSERMAVDAVSTFVNSPANDGPKCVEVQP